MASKGDTNQAGETALALAELMGPAQARPPGCSTTQRGMDELMTPSTGSTRSPVRRPAATCRRCSPTPRAMRSRRAAALSASAAEFRSGGFDLFAAELDTLRMEKHRGAGATKPADDCRTRAFADLDRAGNPWTPIVDALGERESLTARQLEICRLVVLGLTNSQVAEELGISKRTVENQLHRSYATLGVDRAGLSDISL